MDKDLTHLDELQHAYKAAVEEWIQRLREEEDLASQNHSLAEVDRWEAAHFREEEFRLKAKKAKADYEEALRKEFFHF